MLRNYPIGKGDLGVSKTSVALSSAPTPKGIASASVSISGTGVG